MCGYYRDRLLDSELDVAVSDKIITASLLSFPWKADCTLDKDSLQFLKFSEKCGISGIDCYSVSICG